MNDIFGAALITLISFVAGMLIGISAGDESIKKDCEQLKSLRAEGKVFTCEARNG